MTCWVGDRAVSTSWPIAFSLNAFNQLLDYPKVDVGLEQRHADFAQSGLHVRRGEFALAAEIFEDTLQLVAKIVEHGSIRPDYRSAQVS